MIGVNLKWLSGKSPEICACGRIYPWNERLTWKVLTNLTLTKFSHTYPSFFCCLFCFPNQTATPTWVTNMVGSVSDGPVTRNPLRTYQGCSISLHSMSYCHSFDISPESDNNIVHTKLNMRDELIHYVGLVSLPININTVSTTLISSWNLVFPPLLTFIPS